jgi:hypothetical protein
MRIAQIVAAVSLAVVAVGSAAAQDSSLQTIEVRAQDVDTAIVIACANPETPSLQEVERVLSITEVGQANGLRNKLMEAAAEACAAQTPAILVSRNASGGVTWKPAKS